MMALEYNWRTRQQQCLRVASHLLPSPRFFFSLSQPLGLQEPGAGSLLCSSGGTDGHTHTLNPYYAALEGHTHKHTHWVAHEIMLRLAHTHTPQYPPSHPPSISPQSTQLSGVLILFRSEKALLPRRGVRETHIIYQQLNLCPPLSW